MKNVTNCSGFYNKTIKLDNKMAHASLRVAQHVQI